MLMLRLIFLRQCYLIINSALPFVILLFFGLFSVAWNFSLPPSFVSTSSCRPQALAAQPTHRRAPALRQSQWRFLIRGTKQICIKISLCHIFCASKIIINHFDLFLNSQQLLALHCDNLPVWTFWFFGLEVLHKVHGRVPICFSSI